MIRQTQHKWNLKVLALYKIVESLWSFNVLNIGFAHNSNENFKKMFPIRFYP